MNTVMQYARPRSIPVSCAAAVCLALALGTVACIKPLLIDGQIESTREAASALDTIGDYELARSAVLAGIAQFEEMHALAPSNPDALFLLTKSWTSYGFAFIEDELQAAEDAGDEDQAEALRVSARAAYDRAIGYGLALLSRKDSGFEKARCDGPTLGKWLVSTFAHAEDAPALLWTGQAWLSRVNVTRSEDDAPAMIAEAWVGAALVERAVALDASTEHYAGLAVLGAYNASSGYAPLAKAKEFFEEAFARTQGRALLPQLLYATTYACVKGDARLYRSLLTGVAAGDDPDASQRLQNAIARRRARRWLKAKRAHDVCGFALDALQAKEG